MALLDLSKVTSALMKLLELNVERLSSIDVTVTPQPPDKVGAVTNHLSLHLYHVAEDGYYKNALGAGSDIPNVAKAPMALNLFYILTVHHESDNERQDALTEQKLMGFALKTFHDFPVITDQTQIGGAFIIDPLDHELQGHDNPLQIVMRPVSPEDALAFWNSEEQRTARLSAYYEVRVVMLEPETPKTMPGIVLSLGTFLVQIGTPHLDRSQSVVRFTIPEKNGGTVQQVEATPARVTLDNSAAPPEVYNRLLLLGTNLTIGKSRSLFLRNGIWAKLPPPDGPVEQTVVDLAQNPDWRIEFQTDRVTVKLAPVLRHVRPDTAVVDLPVLPGFYSAFVRAVKDEKVINNELKQISVSSNEIGFAVAPRIVGHEAPDVNGNIQVNLGSEFDPLNPNLPEDAIQVIVDGEVYTSVDSDPPASAKEFFVTNTPSNLIRIKPHFPVAVTELAAHPFRLIVNGAESAPFWIELSP
jgi:hypothetical protein